MLIVLCLVCTLIPLAFALRASGKARKAFEASLSETIDEWRKANADRISAEHEKQRAMREAAEAHERANKVNQLRAEELREARTREEDLLRLRTEELEVAAESARRRDAEIDELKFKLREERNAAARFQSDLSNKESLLEHVRNDRSTLATRLSWFEHLHRKIENAPALYAPLLGRRLRLTERLQNGRWVIFGKARAKSVKS